MQRVKNSLGIKIMKLSRCFMPRVSRSACTLQ